MTKAFKYILLLAILSFSGCRDNSCVCPDLYAPVCGQNGKTYPNPCEAECEGVNYVDGECPVYGIGTVEFSGDTACGYYISILGTFYKPQFLPAKYEEDNLFIGMRYRRLNDFYTCDEPYGHHQVIAILEIEVLE